MQPHLRGDATSDATSFTSIAHRIKEAVLRAAEQSAEVHTEELRQLGLKPARDKSENFLLNPLEGPAGLRRRSEDSSRG